MERRLSESPLNSAFLDGSVQHRTHAVSCRAKHPKGRGAEPPVLLRLPVPPSHTPQPHTNLTGATVI
jgi:hypothetical protein